MWPFHCGCTPLPWSRTLSKVHKIRQDEFCWETIIPHCNIFCRGGILERSWSSGLGDWKPCSHDCRYHIWVWSSEQTQEQGQKWLLIGHRSISIWRTTCHQKKTDHDTSDCSPSDWTGQAAIFRDDRVLTCRNVVLWRLDWASTFEQEKVYYILYSTGSTQKHQLEQLLPPEKDIIWLSAELRLGINSFLSSG